MDLLPADFSEFRSKQFWETFFERRGDEPFEWYSEWDELRGFLRDLCATDEDILVAGCGNSELSAQWFDAGYTKITNIDFSRKVIQDMLKKHVTVRRTMRWLVMDMTSTKFPDATFDVVFDKGGLDALMGEPGEEATEVGQRFLSEVARLIKPNGGRYICITLAQEHILELLLANFRSQWEVSMHRIPPSARSIRSSLRPFLVFAKSIHNPQGEQVLPVAVTFSYAVSEGSDDFQMTSLLSVVNAENERRRRNTEAHLIIPEEAALCPTYVNGCTREPVDDGVDLDSIEPGRRVVRTLFGGKYTAFVMDSKKEFPQSTTNCGVFLIPQGREHEYIFNRENGHWQIVESARAARLIIVHLNRGYKFVSNAAVQAELSPEVIKLAPASCRDNPSQISYMTTGDGIGKRTILEEGILGAGQLLSPMTGKIMVEEVELTAEEMASYSDDHGLPSSPHTFRRLMFLRNPNLIQSEALVIGSSQVAVSSSAKLSKQTNGGQAARGKKKGAKKESQRSPDLPPPAGAVSSEKKVDHSHLGSKYHAAMVAGLSLIEPGLSVRFSKGAKVNALVIGLGGGALPMFLHQHLPFDVKVVELDGVIGQLASRHFGFLEDDRMKLVMGDGVVAIHELAQWSRKYRDGASAETHVPTKNNVDSATLSELTISPQELNGAAAVGDEELTGLDHRPKSQVLDLGGGSCEERLHFLIVDADAEDPRQDLSSPLGRSVHVGIENLGMSCPPHVFLEKSFLTAARAALVDDGLLAINVVSRAGAPSADVVDMLCRLFAEVYITDVDKDVNRVLFALPAASRSSMSAETLCKAAKQVMALGARHAPWSKGPDLSGYAKKFKKLGTSPTS
eukprot:SM000045S16291  [mRNA]  locus=s45:698278:703942:+ [translate_table: standard]